MNADGIAYLDIGDAYFHADWANAINAVWSPLYSWILGLVNFIVQPSMQWEFAVVHIVNFVIYLFALLSFEFMWSNVREQKTTSLSAPLWWALGYLLFIWTSLSLIQIWSVTPDMLMAGFVLLAAGLIAKIRAGANNLRFFLALGLILGLGYLSKTFMFSFALVFLALTWLVQKRTRSATVKTLLVASVFLLISLPFIWLISNAKGKITIGEAGTVTFVRHVIGIPYPHWQGDALLGLMPLHPSRIIHESPRVYEFGDPIDGTYPIATDPSYWYEGIEPHFEFDSLLARLLSSSLVYAELFFQRQGILVTCVLAMYIMGQRGSYTIWEILQRWALVIPAVVTFGLYAAILVEGRYIGVFILLFWTDILANVRLPDTSNNGTWLNVLNGIALLGLLANIAMFNLDGFKRLNPTINSAEQTAPPAKPLEVAQTLHNLGIDQGDTVGVIGYAYDSFWARLARVKIVAEMSATNAGYFWMRDNVMQQSVLHAFAEVGVSAVVAEYVPDNVELPDWHRIGKSNYFIYVVAK